MKLLELYGTVSSFHNIGLSYGLDVLSVKISNKGILSDIIPHNYNPDMVIAAPPCKHFSVAAVSKNWLKKGNNYYPRNTNTIDALKMINILVCTIKSLEPKFWFIENPVSVLRKMIGGIFDNYDLDYINRSLTYCQYGDDRMKPTDFWTNCYSWVPKPKCKRGSSCHISAPRGSRKGTQKLNLNQRALIPPKLCKEIIEICINKGRNLK